MSKESSTQTKQLSVWGTKADLRVRVGRPQTSWAPQWFHCWPSQAELLFCLLLVFFLFIFSCPFSLLLYLLCLFVLYVILALWPPALQYQLPSLLFDCVLFVLYLLFVVVSSGEPKQNQGRGLVDHRLVRAPPPSPSNFIAGRPKAALLFWFFGVFTCGVLLFVVVFVIYMYKYQNR